MNGSIRLEPMTAGMILDATVRIYLRHGWTLLGIVALAYVPQLFLSILAAVGAMLGGDWMPLVGCFTLLGYFVWSAVLWPFAMGAASIALSQAYLGQSPDAGKALRAAWRRLGTLFLTAISIGFIVMLGFLLLIVPGILLWLAFSVAIPVVALEGAGVEQGLQRSVQLTRGHRGKIFLVLAVFVVLQVAFQFSAVGTMVAFGAAPNGLSSQLVQSVVAIILAPLSITANILIYYDLRIRKEGFDLEVLSGASQGVQPTSGVDLP